MTDIIVNQSYTCLFTLIKKTTMSLVFCIKIKKIPLIDGYSILHKAQDYAATEMPALKKYVSGVKLYFQTIRSDR